MKGKIRELPKKRIEHRLRDQGADIAQLWKDKDELYERTRRARDVAEEAHYVGRRADYRACNATVVAWVFGIVTLTLSVIALYVG